MRFSRRRIVAAAGASLVVFWAPWRPLGAAVGDPVDPEITKLRDSVRKLKHRNRKSQTGHKSRNGWEMETNPDTHGTIYRRPVPGVPVGGIQVRMGDVELILVHVVQRFHYEIDLLRAGDVRGWKSPNEIRGGAPESNLASGTAVEIRRDSYPPGISGGFFDVEVAVLRDILAELDGVVRWGGDDQRVQESLFYIDVPPSSGKVGEVAKTLRRWQQTPGLGAGAVVDVLSPRRRGAAENLRRKQATAVH